MSPREGGAGASRRRTWFPGRFLGRRIRRGPLKLERQLADVEVDCARFDSTTGAGSSNGTLAGHLGLIVFGYTHRLSPMANAAWDFSRHSENCLPQSSSLSALRARAAR